MGLLFIDQNGWNGVYLKVLLGYFWRRSVERTMGLEELRHIVERVPEKSRLRSNVGEKHWIIALQQIYAGHLGHLLDWWSRHSHNELQELLFSSVTVVDVVAVSLDAEID